MLPVVANPRADADDVCRGSSPCCVWPLMYALGGGPRRGNAPLSPAVPGRTRLSTRRAHASSHADGPRSRPPAGSFALDLHKTRAARVRQQLHRLGPRCNLPMAAGTRRNCRVSAAWICTRRPHRVSSEVEWAERQRPRARVGRAPAPASAPAPAPAYAPAWQRRHFTPRRTQNIGRD
ncbi:hypothetical protein EVAR_12895_1 [Eumeta japonica]|uniref:Uncharacterized protein n=1 Tax=Eumeta variegata TaxID=151549 RepID=A0A4C1TWT3_EUMVA|nr:hypothetical protein EVAR_12895_1 [Eumeta japonica]